MKRKPAPIEKAVLKTLIYADLFDYPLLVSEVPRYLISSRPVSRPRVVQCLREAKTNSKQFGTDGTHFFLARKSKLVEIRKGRKWISLVKFKKAQKAASWLKLIPSVRLIGLSGALAMANAGVNDDIDLMFVVSPRRLWLTRGFIVFALRLLRLYRRPDKIKDRLCPNLFLDENHLQIPENERNLFTAHEIVQVRCLWEREGAYQKLLNANEWVLAYLPNAFAINGARVQRFRGSEKASPRRSASAHLRGGKAFDLLEKLAFRAQLLYMRSKRTREITEPGRIFFHPRDRGKEILVKYRQRLTDLGIKD